MRFLVDEALSLRVAEGLRAAGHDAVHVHELGMTSATDSAVIQAATASDRIVVTADADYTAHLAIGGMRRPSLIFFRGPGTHTPSAQLALLHRVVSSFAVELEDGALLVVESGRVRVRTLPLGS